MFHAVAFNGDTGSGAFLGTGLHGGTGNDDITTGLGTDTLVFAPDRDKGTNWIGATSFADLVDDPATQLLIGDAGDWLA